MLVVAWPGASARLPLEFSAYSTGLIYRFFLVLVVEVMELRPPPTVTYSLSTWLPPKLCMLCDMCDDWKASRTRRS